jgi:hypothetical protein
MGFGMNLHTQKKTCDGCAAGKHLYCGLGYKTGGHMCRTIKGFALFGIPLEKCPKPRTNGELQWAMKWYKKVGV